jgi:hypothetical protein
LYCDRNPQSNFLFDIKPDISVYSGSPDPSIKTDSSLAEIFIEFKWKISDDPFCNVDGDRRTFLRDTKKADDTLGQITAYAAVQLAAQFRTHAYFVFILRDTARILRWDRAGTIVTEAIEYNKSPHLAEFFRRYSKASAAMRGKDESVSDPTPSEERAARDALKLEPNVPLFKLSIPNANGRASYFITCPPEPSLYTPPGRATRGFRAYDVTRRRLVFLKDSWRIDLPDILPEGQMYKILNDAKVKHVPNCLASGDICSPKYHATKTQNYSTAPWACPLDTQFVPHRHCRLTLNVIGFVLVNYKASYEMVAALRNGIIGEFLVLQLDCSNVQHCSALKEAYVAGVLHRDFSPGNIIIDQDSVGWLIDWDLSKLVSGSEVPRRATRTVRSPQADVITKPNQYNFQGTWQFMSAGLISGSSNLHDFRDDLESSIYVLLWTTLMYSEVSNRDVVPTFLSGVLDPQPYGNNGGFGKADFLKGRTFLSNVQFPGRPLLHTLIDRLAQLFSVRYDKPPSQEDRDAVHWLKDAGDPRSLASYNASIPGIYDQRMSQLKDHDTTIALFDNALQDRSKWPLADSATLQIFGTKVPHRPITKTGWYTGLYMQPVQLTCDEAVQSDDTIVGTGEF